LHTPCAAPQIWLMRTSHARPPRALEIPMDAPFHLRYTCARSRLIAIYLSSDTSCISLSCLTCTPASTFTCRLYFAFKGVLCTSIKCVSLFCLSIALHCARVPLLFRPSFSTCRCSSDRTAPPVPTPLPVLALAALVTSRLSRRARE
jgi:MYXO-CTERM domain-containing protein